MSRVDIQVVIGNFRMLEQAMNRCAESFRQILDLELQKAVTAMRAGRGAGGTAARMNAVRRPRRSAAKRTGAEC